VRCELVFPDDLPAPEDFTVTVTDASDVHGVAMDPPPVVRVASLISY